MLKIPPHRRFSTVSDVTKGAVYMTLAAFLFALMNSLVRVASQELPPLEVVFFRNLFAVASMLPWMLSRGFPGFPGRHIRLHLARALAGVVSMGLWFTSLAVVPLADAVALNFTMPLFIVAGAAIVLREEVGPRRWIATAIGFCGMLVILRPGLAEVTLVMLLPVIAAVFMAVSVLLLKHMSATERAGTSVLYMNLLMTPLSLVPALFVWEWPAPADFIVLAAIGFQGMLAHLALAASLAKADASAVMPFDYARLPFVALFAFLLFGEVAEMWTWIGAGIIAASALYIARREAVLARSGAGKLPLARPGQEP